MAQGCEPLGLKCQHADIGEETMRLIAEGLGQRG
jgi:hypothetical protein